MTDIEQALSDFLDALDAWGCEDNLERAKQILEFQRSGYCLAEYLDDQPAIDKKEIN